MRRDKTKAEYREKRAIVIEGGREGFCANLLCNVWQHACMFVVVFHTDNHVLTHSKWRNILHCLQFLLVLTKNVAYVSLVCSVFLKEYNGTFLASPEL